MTIKMTSIRTKAAYMLFIIFFGIWLSLILLVCFPSGKWTIPIRFPNLVALAVFLGSAAMSSVSCLFLGLDYLGLRINLGHRPRSQAAKAWLIRAKNASADVKPLESSACASLLVLAPEEVDEITVPKKKNK